MSPPELHRRDAEVAPFREGRIASGPSFVRYLEAGRGKPLIVLCSDVGKAADAAAFALLARQCRVVLLQAATDRPAEQVATHAQAARDLAGGRYGLLGASAAAGLAVAMAVSDPENVESLILAAPGIIPPSPGSAPIDRQLQTSLIALRSLPLLVLFGTDDEMTPPELGRAYVELLPECFFVLVYDAGHAIARDRPQAFASVVGDFVAQPGARFLMPVEGSIINP